VPDVGGDGIDDVVIGAPYEIFSSPEAGRAYLYNPVTHAIVSTLGSPNKQAGGRFGTSVAGLSDTTGDGKGDLLVGAPLETASGEPSHAGRAYLFNGATGASVRTLQSPSKTANGLFGLALAGAGDVNGHGIGDALICA
jgi:hypothetical protein